MVVIVIDTDETSSQSSQYALWIAHLQATQEKDETKNRIHTRSACITVVLSNVPDRWQSFHLKHEWLCTWNVKRQKNIDFKRTAFVSQSTDKTFSISIAIDESKWANIWKTCLKFEQFANVQNARKNYFFWRTLYTFEKKCTEKNVGNTGLFGKFQEKHIKNTTSFKRKTKYLTVVHYENSMFNKFFFRYHTFSV